MARKRSVNRADSRYLKWSRIKQCKTPGVRSGLYGSGSVAHYLDGGDGDYIYFGDKGSMVMSAGRWEIRNGVLYEDYYGYMSKSILAGALIVGALGFYFGSTVLDMLDHPWQYSSVSVIAAYFYGLTVVMPVLFVMKVFVFLEQLTPFANLNSVLAWLGSAAYLILTAGVIIAAYQFAGRKLNKHPLTIFATPGLVALGWAAVRWAFS